MPPPTTPDHSHLRLSRRPVHSTSRVSPPPRHTGSFIACRVSAADFSDELLAVFLQTCCMNVTTPPPPTPLLAFHRVWECLERVTLTSVWLFSDEGRSVQPSNQVHRGLHRPPQHLHRDGVLPQRQPAGNTVPQYSPVSDRSTFGCERSTAKTRDKYCKIPRPPPKKKNY